MNREKRRRIRFTAMKRSGVSFSTMTGFEDQLYASSDEVEETTREIMKTGILKFLKIHRHSA